MKKLLLILLCLPMIGFGQNCQIIDSAIVTDVKCHLGTDGSINLVPLNTVGLYSYAFSNGQNGTISEINNLIAGTYSVIITDLANTIYFLK